MRDSAGILRECVVAHHDCTWQKMVSAMAPNDGSLWPLEFCAVCGLVRLGRIPSVQEAYPPDYYGSGQSKFLPGIEWLSRAPPALMGAAARLAAQVPHPAKPPRVLDVGCGRGYLLRQFRRMGWLASGIDINGSPVPVGDADLDCKEGDASLLPWPSGYFDLVVMNHVLEHVADPWGACGEAARVLRAGGILYVGVPNYESFQQKLFGAHWFPLEIPRHLYHFSPRSLAAVTESAGFSVLHQTTRSCRQGVFGFIQSALDALDRGHPSFLLSVLKGGAGLFSPRSLLHVAVGILLAPIAFLETLIAWAFGRGSVVILVCQKKP